MDETLSVEEAHMCSPGFQLPFCHLIHLTSLGKEMGPLGNKGEDLSQAASPSTPRKDRSGPVPYQPAGNAAAQPWA